MYSKPIPESSDLIKDEESVLKIQHRIDGRNIHRGMGPDIEELQMLTFTPRFQWKDRARNTNNTPLDIREVFQNLLIREKD